MGSRSSIRVLPLGDDGGADAQLRRIDHRRGGRVQEPAVDRQRLLHIGDGDADVVHVPYGAGWRVAAHGTILTVLGLHYAKVTLQWHPVMT